MQFKTHTYVNSLFFLYVSFREAILIGTIVSVIAVILFIAFLLMRKFSKFSKQLFRIPDIYKINVCKKNDILVYWYLKLVHNRLRKTIQKGNMQNPRGRAPHFTFGSWKRCSGRRQYKTYYLVCYQDQFLKKSMHVNQVIVINLSRVLCRNMKYQRIFKARFSLYLGLLVKEIGKG